MRFYDTQHRYYCGVDLHARTLYVCVIDASGAVRLHKRLPCEPARFLEALEPYRPDVVVGVECIFCWYWLADLCAFEDIPFVLGHALRTSVPARHPSGSLPFSPFGPHIR